MPRKVRPIRVDGQVAYVTLTKGYVAKIDAEDVPVVAGYNWTSDVRQRKDGTVYTVYGMRLDHTNGRARYVSMHRSIAKTPKGVITDHINGDGLDNRKINLRTATVGQNQSNSRVRSDNTSGVKGVIWDKSRSKWRAEIVHNGKRHFLGRFDIFEDAAEAYAKASAELHGPFGRLA